MKDFIIRSVKNEKRRNTIQTKRHIFDTFRFGCRLASVVSIEFILNGLEINKNLCRRNIYPLNGTKTIGN